ncbi:MAG: hypothetical protein IPJ84_14950 [Bdellovibrionales bacterium]|nr:hypothetical protein [Bdellovibrionales bacterium]
MTIGKRATIGFAIMMLFVIISSGLSLYLNHRSQASLNVFMDSAKKKDLQAKLERHILDATLGYMDAIVDKDSATIADEITRAVDSLATEIKSMTAKDVGISEKEWQDFLKLEDAYTKQGQLMFSDIRSKRNDRFAEHDDVIDGQSGKILEMINIWQIAIDKQATSDSTSMNRAFTFTRDATAALLVVALILGSFLAYLLSKQINALLGAVAKKLETNVENVRVSSNGLGTLGEDLSSRASEQAAGLTESASVMEELSTTVQRTAEASGETETTAADCAEKAENGRVAAEQMRDLVLGIRNTNQMMVKTVEENNQRFEEITRAISEINDKTRVINEIVFQTKLLSFNASVEAARAGEAGKGFSVVAEEIGSLATVSGKAAKEISELLERSTVRVREIVQTISKQSNEAASQIDSQVRVGTEQAEQCRETLELVVRSVAHMKQNVSEISRAAKEQANGIHEVSKAIREISVVTEQNAHSANETANSAKDMIAVAAELDSAMNDLKAQIAA